MIIVIIIVIILVIIIIVIIIAGWPGGSLFCSADDNLKGHQTPAKKTPTACSLTQKLPSCSPNP